MIKSIISFKIGSPNSTKHMEIPLFQNFVEALLKDAHRLRVLISERRRQQREEEKKRQDEREAMKEARNLACSILNMTSEDLNSLMDEENDKV